MENIISLLAEQWFLKCESKQKNKYRKETLSKTRELYEQLIRRNCHVTFFGDENYPDSLKSLKNPPLALSYYGQPVWKSHKCVAIVGSRNPSLQTMKWLDQNIPPLLHNGRVCIVSGGARGIDQKAHSVCIRNNVPTVCFIPSGLFDLYPKTLQKYVQPIVECGGAVVSQFSPTKMMYKSNFHARNLLISAISDYVFIAEAKLRSGSMLTARMAIEQGKNIGTLPYFPSDESGSGSLQLLYDGADMIKDSRDLIMQILGE